MTYYLATTVQGQFDRVLADVIERLETEEEVRRRLSRVIGGVTST